MSEVMTLDTTNTEMVYVGLIDEGVNVWRPTQAEKLPDGSYKLLPTSEYDPEDETWEFLPGSRVVCENRRLSNGEVMTAVRLAGAERQSVQPHR